MAPLTRILYQIQDEFHEPLDTIDRVTDQPSSSTERARQWETIYAEKDPTSVSWYQEEPVLSLELFDVLDVARDAAVIDVGGGESLLVDRLLAKGFSDLTVLEVSPSAIAVSAQRVGDGRAVVWIAQDLLSWQPERRYDLWHDRAVFHFLAGPEIETYRMLVDRALAPNGVVILGTFASDGPESCSGLATHRYGPNELGSVLGVGYEVVEQRRELHHTPSGVVQPFTWIAARRRPG